MADSYVQVPADDVGKKIEMEQVTDGLGNIVQRQVIKVAEIDATAFPATQTVDGAVTVSGGVTLDDVVVALYQMIQALQRPVSVDYSTGRLRVLVDAVTSTVAIPVTLSTANSLAFRNMMSDQLDRTSWGINIGGRIT